MKKILLAFVFVTSNLITLPAFSWPEVDHMNMCGPATKVVRSYAGHWQGWKQHDRYISRRGNAYYFKHNCPETSAPLEKAVVKKSAMTYKSGAATVEKNQTKVTALKGNRKPRSDWLIKRSKRLVFSKRKDGYDKHADCMRVDRLNNYGRPLNVIRRY